MALLEKRKISHGLSCVWRLEPISFGVPVGFYYSPLVALSLEWNSLCGETKKSLFHNNATPNHKTIKRLHGLCRQLCEQHAAALLERDAVAGELVIRREPRCKREGESKRGSIHSWKLLMLISTTTSRRLSKPTPQLKRLTR